MRRSFMVLAILLIPSLTGCYLPLTAKVVDAETGEPIEGAVVLVEWTIQKGIPGLVHGESYKAVSAVTNKDGKVTISGVFNPFVDPPQVTVYKKGYVAWNNLYIFPNSEDRQNFKYKNGMVIPLEKFKPDYSYIQHTMFILSSINSGLGNPDSKKIMEDAIEWEENLAREERDRQRTQPLKNGK